MTSATDAARVDRLECEGAPGRPRPESGAAETASGGGRRPGIADRFPGIELDTPADREGAK